jgi:hypothetical protein
MATGIAWCVEHLEQGRLILAIAMFLSAETLDVVHD